MSSPVMRMLLKLYPRRIRNRYGDELLDLHDELRAHGDVSRTRLIRDAIAGAVLVRSARQRAHLMTAAVLVAVALAIVGTTIAAGGTDSPAGASHLEARLTVGHVNAVPYGSCFVAEGSSCSLAPCTVFTGQPSTEDAAAYSSEPATQRRPHSTTGRCAGYRGAGPQHPVFVARVVKPAHRRRRQPRRQVASSVGRLAHQAQLGQ